MDRLQGRTVVVGVTHCKACASYHWTGRDNKNDVGFLGVARSSECGSTRGLLESGR